MHEEEFSSVSVQVILYLVFYSKCQKVSFRKTSPVCINSNPKCPIGYRHCYNSLMAWGNIANEQKDHYNAVVHHPLQSYEWGEFREATGVKVIRKGFFEKEKLISAFQLTIHKIPHTNFT